MRGGIRRRLVVLFTSFAAVIGLVAIVAVLTVYHRVEDAFVGARLQEALGSRPELGDEDPLAAETPSVIYVGEVEAAPEPFAERLEGEPAGRYEWELAGREAHALVTAERPPRVAIYSVSEVEAREQWLEVLLWSGFGAVFLSAFLLARSLAVRTVAPVEELTARISDAGLGVLPTGLNEGLGEDEVAVLAATLDEAGARLQASIERERRFLREASHELRTPITVIQGAYDLLAESVEPADEAGRRRLARIGRSLRRIDLSLSSLLAIARAEHRAAVDRTSSAQDLEDVIAEARSIAPPGVEVEVQIARHPWLVAAPTVSVPRRGALEPAPQRPREHPTRSGECLR